MADVKAIRDRVAARIKAGVSGLMTYDTMPSQPVVPCAIVTPAQANPLGKVTMDGAEDVNLVVIVLVQKVVDEAAQDATDTYLSEGASDIAAAIDSGATTDWDYAQTLPARNYGAYTFGTGEGALSYLGFEIPVEVGVS